MSKRIDIVRWAESPIGFYVDRTYDTKTGQWVIGPAPIKLAPYHRDIVRHVFTPDESGRLPYDTACIAEPAKGGKSALCGLVTQYAALHGEQGSEVILAANTQNQAQSRMYHSFCESVRMNPALDIEPGRLETHMPNGNSVKAIASNSRGAAGARFSLVAFDEPAGYIYQDLERLVAEHKIDPTRQMCLRWFTGYAGYTGESTLWQDLLEGGLKGDPVPDLAHITNGVDPACWRRGRQFTFWSHVCRQPWQSKQWIEEQRRTLRPAEFQRMILCEFSEGMSTFLDQALWEALIDPEHKPVPPHSPLDTDAPEIYVGLDLAFGVGGDDCALVGLYPEDGKVKVAFHKVWKGKDRKEQLKFSETVRPYLIWLNGAYRLQGVWMDPTEGRLLAEDLKAAGIHSVNIVNQSHKTRAPKDTALWQLAANGRLVLYDDPDLRFAGVGAMAQELGDGQIYLKKTVQRARVDLLIAMAQVADVVLMRGKYGPPKFVKYI